MNDMLNILNNAGLIIRIYSPKNHYSETWEVVVEKQSEGTELKIVSRDDNLYVAVQVAYDRWVLATTKGLPDFGLNQIEHHG